MINISIDPIISRQCPEMAIGLVRANVVNTPTSDALWALLEAEAERIKNTYELLAVNARPAIAGTRRLYKVLGKDPGRYRVSSEQLCRRIIKGLGIYRLTTLIDVVNLVSMTSGYSIGGLDADKIEGDIVTMGVGDEGEPYEGIGRGTLNIAGMPVYRDAIGAIASPTSDSERTKITPETTKVQIFINAFAIEMPIEETVNSMASLLTQFAQASNIETLIYHP